MGRFKNQASPLERLRFSAAYRRFLRLGVTVREEWRQEHPGALEASMTVLEMDRALESFVDDGFTGGKQFYIIKHAILEWQMRYPQCRFHLPLTWAKLTTWAATRPWQPRVPAPEEVSDDLFLGALEKALKAGRQKLRRLWVSLGILWRISFYALLRPGESLQLHPEDIYFVDAPSSQVRCVIAIRSPKTRWIQGAGRAQFATLSHPGAVAWLRVLVSDSARGKPIWSESRSTHSTMFKDLVMTLGLGATGITPASGRAGGTTCMFMFGRSLERIFRRVSLR